MFPITKMMLFAAIPAFLFFGFRAIQQMRNQNKSQYQSDSKLSNFFLWYLIIGFSFFLSGLSFPLEIGFLFDIYWAVATIGGIYFCVKEYRPNPIRSLAFLTLTFPHALLVPYIILFTFM